MNIKKTFIALLFTLIPLFNATAQEVAPSAHYIKDKVETQSTQITDGEAPLAVTFKANPTAVGDYTPSYEWQFFRKESETSQTRILVRYEEDTEYTFVESGTFTIQLIATFVNGTDTVLRQAAPITVTISESKLEMPNAFSPNNDGYNDKYKAKPGYKSIVSFHAYIFNRWGQKLYEWDNVADGWDGTHNGHDVPDGVYFVLVKAKGADGRDYNIRRDVNLLRGYTNKSGTTTK
jgi:gliding motility-associated-like protein